MNRSREKIDRRMRARTLPLILPMPRSSYRLIEPNSPWLSIDPVFGQECVALCRSVRLVLLALIAFMTGPRRMRADAASGETRSHASAEGGHNFELKSCAPQQQMKARSRSVEAPASPSIRRRRSSSIRAGDIRAGAVIGATAGALDAAKRFPLEIEARKAHGPPPAPLVTALNTIERNRFNRLLKSDLQRRAGVFAAYRQAFRGLETRPGQDSQLPVDAQLRAGKVAGATALAIDEPKKQTHQLETIRAHAPPTGRANIGFDFLWFDYSLTQAYSLEHFAPPIFEIRSAENSAVAAAAAKPAQDARTAADGKRAAMNLVNTSSKYIFINRDSRSQSTDCYSRPRCTVKGAENSGSRRLYIRHFRLTNPPEGDYIYVCQ